MIKSLLKRWLFPVDVKIIQRTVLLDGKIAVRTNGRTMIIPFQIAAQSPAEAAGVVYSLADCLGMNEAEASMEAVPATDSDAVTRLLKSLEAKG